MGKRDICSITEVHIKEKGVLPPILASFQHGSLIPEEASNLCCSIAHNIDTGKRDVTLETKHNNIVYRASEDNDEEVKHYCKTMIAIRNKRTNKVRLFEASTVILSPIIKEKKKLEINVGERNNDYALLQKSFGSKTGKRHAELQERSQTDVDTLAGNINQAVAKVEVFNVDYPEVTGALMCPPCNRKATKVEDVYLLEDIITKEELQSMEEKALEVIENSSNLDKNEYSLLFLENLPKILSQSKNQLESIEVLLYIDCLIKFFNDPLKNQSMLSRTCPYSQLITKKIRQEFTEESSSKRLRPNKLRIKAFCQIIVLCLLLFNYKFDLITIINSSKESITRLNMYTRAIGATTLSKNSTMVTLKLPLAEAYVPLMSKDKKKTRR